MPDAVRALATIIARSARATPVFLDANILLPQYLRSTFLDLADAGLIQAHWSPLVLKEVQRNLVKPAFGQTARQAAEVVRLLDRAFPDARIRASKMLEHGFSASVDAKDIHVAASALKLSQRHHPDLPVFLVTNNTRHLPQAAFLGTRIRSLRPGVFLAALLKARPRTADVLAAMLLRFKAPSVAQDDYLNLLDRHGCSIFATALANHWGYAAA
ncbi:PIN domain-containing protein [Achromobacter sp. Marseille-Q0513]|uniref:PIN domain-containing protein n=1 Tax=Achromobacter sp. Marseille-Q0513 TaxID=2829161 RepID=UPI001B96163B|nr:PIN domain-containing protein [Achromobacter sp. Marseille-Q0513]MBR8657261.1 PIN domain-containing protein [Achromobacter sp. Marseille-Q0513]